MCERTHNNVRGAEKDATEIWCHYRLYAKLMNIIKSYGWISFEQVDIEGSSDTSILTDIACLTGGPAQLFLFTNDEYRIQCVLPMDGNEEKMCITIFTGKELIHSYEMSISYWQYQEKYDFLRNIHISQGSKIVINMIVNEIRDILKQWMECFNKGDYDGCFRITKDVQ